MELHKKLLKIFDKVVAPLWLHYIVYEKRDESIKLDSYEPETILIKWSGKKAIINKLAIISATLHEPIVAQMMVEYLSNQEIKYSTIKKVMASYTLTAIKACKDRQEGALNFEEETMFLSSEFLFRYLQSCRLYIYNELATEIISGENLASIVETTEDTCKNKYYIV